MQLFKGLDGKAEAKDVDKLKKTKADHEMIEQLIHRMENFEDIAKNALEGGDENDEEEDEYDQELSIGNDHYQDDINPLVLHESIKGSTQSEKDERMEDPGPLINEKVIVSGHMTIVEGSQVMK